MMMNVQRILFALMLLVAYPAIADMAARAEALPGATGESLQQQLYRAANEARDPNRRLRAVLSFLSNDDGDG